MAVANSSPPFFAIISQQLERPTIELGQARKAVALALLALAWDLRSGKMTH